MEHTLRRHMVFMVVSPAVPSWYMYGTPSSAAMASNKALQGNQQTAVEASELPYPWPMPPAIHGSDAKNME